MVNSIARIKSKSGLKADGVFVLLVFCIFTVSILTTLMLGAGVYKNVVSKVQNGQDERTCLSYIWTKIKNADNTVYTGSFHGNSALFIIEEHDGVEYNTIIYLYDGWVRELFSETGLEFLPEDGMPVIETDTLVFEQQDDGLIKVTANSGSLLILPRVNRGGGQPA